MTEAVADRMRGLNFLREQLVGRDLVTEGWLGLEVLLDGSEAVIVFRWQDDPTVYGVRVDLDGAHAWWRYEARAVLTEDLLTGLVSRATRRTLEGRTELDRSLADRQRYERNHPDRP